MDESGETVTETRDPLSGTPAAWFAGIVKLTASVGVPIVLSLYFAWAITSSIGTRLDKLTESVQRLTVVMEAKK